MRRLTDGTCAPTFASSKGDVDVTSERRLLPPVSDERALAELCDGGGGGMLGGLGIGSVGTGGKDGGRERGVKDGGGGGTDCSPPSLVRRRLPIPVS